MSKKYYIVLLFLSVFGFSEGLVHEKDVSDIINESYENDHSTRSANVHIVDEVFFMPQFNRKRRVWIYLPEGYENSDKSYPVVYMHDGQNLFDNETSFAGEWGIDEKMDSLISAGAVESIIVGVENGGENRINEYTPFENSEYGGGEGKLYVDFIVNNLKPYIDKNYRTLSNRENTAIVGASLGGLISFYAIMKYKGVFSKAGVMSPSFWFSNLIFFIPGNSKANDVNIYFLAGEKESKTMLSNLKKMTDKMDQMSYPKSSYKVNVISNGEHNEKMWSEGFVDMYLWIWSR